jgi:2-amino-4-hydroxy-6-hydroxymethyldihydropteridine diphosphokinase
MTQTPVDAFVAVGSNIRPEDNIPSALLRLKTYATVIAVSNFYKTVAVGTSAQPDFLNGVVKIQTDRSPRELKFEVLRSIEAQLGRVRSADKYAARTIDLDVILYGTLVIDEPDLHLPDPAIRSYPFVAIPLLELAPDLILPDTRTPLSHEPAAHQTSGLNFQRDFTDTLRRLITHC